MREAQGTSCEFLPAFEREQDPVVLVPHVLSLHFVCRKTLGKEQI